MATAKVFKSGNSQAVRLPKEFQLDVNEVEIFKQGEDIVLRKKPQSGRDVFNHLAAIDLPSDFPETIEDLPIQQRKF